MASQCPELAHRVVVVVQHVQQKLSTSAAEPKLEITQEVWRHVQELVAGLYRTPPELTKRLADMLGRA